MTAATTPAGTMYTVTEWEGAGGWHRWYVADRRRGDAGVPVLLFVHGNGGSYKSLDATAQGQVRDHLVDAGWVVWEGDGGGASNFGNDDAQAALVEGLAAVDAALDTGPVAVLGVSMGGVATYWAGSLSPFADRVAGIVVQEGVSDLTYRYTATEDGTKVLGNAYGLGWTATIQEDAWQVAAEGHDPMWTDPAVWDGKRVLQLWDDTDRTVEWVHHGQKWVERFGAHAQVEVVGTTGGGHSFHPGHRVPAMKWLDALVAGPADPVDPDSPDVRDEPFWRVDRLNVVGPDLALYPVTL